MSARTAFLLLASITTMSWCSITAIAQEADEREIVLAEQALPDSLKFVADEFGLQLAFFSEVAEDFEAPALNGSYTQDQALEALLAETVLEHSYIDNGTVVVRAKNQGGDSDSKNLSSAPVLMAQNQTTPTQTAVSSRSDDKQDDETDESSQTLRIPEILVIGKTRNVDIARTRDDVQPYVVLGVADIENSQATTLDEFFRTRLPMNQVFDSAAQSGGINGGLSSIDLRGLGADQTLILVNGRRMPGVSLFGENLEQSDINGIPLAAVERIEILPATASGIYGGGATGGAINIILKSDYDGFDVSIGYGNSFDWDMAERRIDATAGFSLEDGRTNIVFSGSLSDSDVLLEGARHFARKTRALQLANDPDAIFDFSIAPPAGYTSNINGFGPLRFDDGTPLGSRRTYIPVGYPGVSSDGGAALLANAGQYNLDISNDEIGLRNTLYSTPDRASGNLSVRRSFTNNLDAYIDVSLLTTETSFSYPGSSNITVLGADAPNNPFTTPIIVKFPSMGTELDIRTESEVFSTNIGAVLRLSDTWSATANATLSESNSSVFRSRLSLTPEGNAALSNGDLDVMRDLNEFPLDFGPYLPDRVPPFKGKSTLRNYSLRAGGEIFQTPAGGASLSAMIESREDTKDQRISTIEVFGGGSVFLFYPERSQSVDSVYSELLVPIFSDANSTRGVQSLELQASVRHDRYTTRAPIEAPGGGGFLLPTLDTPRPDVSFQSTDLSSTDYTIGFKYQPIANLALRASFGTGFLPPSVSQMSPMPVQTRFFGASDPKRGGTSVDGPIETTFGGNSNLSAEQSESWSIGLIWTPRFLNGARLSADYVRIEKTDEISSAFAVVETLLASEDDFPDRVVRGALTPEDQALGYTAGPVIGLDLTLTNIASKTVEAIDFQADYSWETDTLGSFYWRLVATRQLAADQQILPGAAVDSLIGYLNGSIEWRGNIGLEWSRDKLSVGWNSRYHSSYLLTSFAAEGTVFDEATVAGSGTDHIDGEFFHDLYVNYKVTDSIDLKLGIKNVLDTEPQSYATPLLTTGLYNRQGDPRLRRFTLLLKMTF